MKDVTSPRKSHRVVAWLFVVLLSLAIPVIEAAATQSDYWEAFATQAPWYSKYWNPRGFVELPIVEEKPIALSCPSSLHLGDGGSAPIVVDVSVDTWFDECSSGVACLFFYSAPAPNQIYFLAIDARGNWNLYHESYSTEYVCSALDLMIDDSHMYPWKSSSYLRIGSFAPNRLSLRFQSVLSRGGNRVLRVVAFVNGQEITTVETTLSAASAVRFGVGGHAAAPEDAYVHFDNLTIREV